MIVGRQLTLHNLARQSNRRIDTPFGQFLQGTILGNLDLLNGTLLFSLGRGLSIRQDLLLLGIRITTRIVEDATHFVSGTGQLIFVVRQELSSRLVLLFGRLDIGQDARFAAVERLRDRPPGELPQDAHQQSENYERPE